MIFGVAATKAAVVIAETKGTGDKFVITAIRPVPFEVRAGDDLAELLRCLATIFDQSSRGASSTIALLQCSSGRFGS
jgi:predicted MarR family transcription regulator